MADRSAAVLAEVLLSDDSPESVGLLARQLAADPPLLLWVVCTSTGALAKPHSVADVAEWFARHALEVLHWDAGQHDPYEPPDTPQSEKIADLVASCLELAELAASLAGSESPEAMEEARLLGLLDKAGHWLALVGDRPKDPAETCLPAWLTSDDLSPARNCVAKAVELLRGKSFPASLEGVADACRQRAAEGRRRWLEAIPGAGATLPILTARLARLNLLESRFEETLETEKLEAMAEFAAGAGHEINNPLAVIAGRAQLFLQDEAAPERRRALALINAQAKRVYEMIADMRLFARPPEPHPEPVELVELIDRLVTKFAPRASEQATSLRRRGDEGPVEIEADPTQLTVALQALYKNSLEAIGHDGRIEIAVHGLADEVQICVSDDGPGIPPDVRRHLFDPFYSARQAGRGLGLGLSKCWRIVTNHGGRIDVDSPSGQGARFTITLPRRQSP